MRDLRARAYARGYYEVMQKAAASPKTDWTQWFKNALTSWGESSHGLMDRLVGYFQGGASRGAEKPVPAEPYGRPVPAEPYGQPVPAEPYGQPVPAEPLPYIPSSFPDIASQPSMSGTSVPAQARYDFSKVPSPASRGDDYWADIVPPMRDERDFQVDIAQTPRPPVDPRRAIIDAQLAKNYALNAGYNTQVSQAAQVQPAPVQQEYIPPSPTGRHMVGSANARNQALIRAGEMQHMPGYEAAGQPRAPSPRVRY